MNLVEIAGFLGADAEERFTATGKRVISLRVAARVRQGGRDETIWWRVNIWGDRFDKMLPYLKKGTGVIVVGEMSAPQAYTSKDGTQQVSLTLNAEIIKFSPFGRPDRDKPAESPFAAASGSSDEPFATVGAGVEENSNEFDGDDLPF
ncbi:MAG: single-stranded DNA-binding protein [Chlamydiales bacterium]